MSESAVLDEAHSVSTERPGASSQRSPTRAVGWLLLGVLALGLIWITPVANRGRRASREATGLEGQIEAARRMVAEATRAHGQGESAWAALREERATLEALLAGSTASVRQLEQQLIELYERLGATASRHAIEEGGAEAQAPIVRLTGPPPKHDCKPIWDPIEESWDFECNR